MGLVPLTQGAVRLDGRQLDGTPTWKMPDLGVVMIPEGRMIFKDMTIEANLMLGAFSQSHRAPARRECDTSYDTFARLRERSDLPAVPLLGGEAQLLALGRGLPAAPRGLLP